MTKIFHYNTLNVSLDIPHRSLIVELNRPEVENSINMEMVFELESLFSWTASHLEINAILIKGSENFFSKGFDLEEFSKLPDEKWKKIAEKLQKLIYSMFFLPQTIIADLKGGAFGPGAELALGADIRLAKHDTQIQFNHLSKAMVPTCGGIGFLGSILGKAFARNWIISSRPIENRILQASGFIHQFYDKDHDEVINFLLKEISSQAPIPRIQAKRSLLEPLIVELDRTLSFEKKFAWAGMQMGDWKKFLNQDGKGEKVKFHSPLDLVAQFGDHPS